MRSFLKSHRLWNYVIGNITPPICCKDEEDTSFSHCFEDWDCKYNQIITWFRHFIVSFIHKKFGHYEHAKDVWDLLSSSYISVGLFHEYQLWGLRVTIKQEPRQPINDFLSCTHPVSDGLDFWFWAGPCCFTLACPFTNSGIFFQRAPFTRDSYSYSYNTPT